MYISSTIIWLLQIITCCLPNLRHKTYEFVFIKNLKEEGVIAQVYLEREETKVTLLCSTTAKAEKALIWDQLA